MGITRVSRSDTKGGVEILTLPAISKRADRLAWVVIWASFGSLCFLLAGLVMAGLWYKSTATDWREADLKVLAGTVLVRAENQPNWLAAGPEMALEPGDSIRTDETSQALLTLFEGSSLFLYPRTELRITRLTSWKFAPNRMSIGLFQELGKARISVTPINGGERDFEVGVPQGLVSLSEGAFSIDVDSEVGQVKVRDKGQAVISTANTSVKLQGGQRGRLVAGNPPSGPESAEVELIRNGDFSLGLEGWMAGNEAGFPEGQDILGGLEVVAEHNQSAVRFSRYGSNNTHCETYIQQEINADVADFSKLALSLELELVYQDLSGGGYQGSEYPVLVRINYLSAKGENFRVYGFYYQNEANNRTDNGIKLTRDLWEQHTVPDNLMEALSPLPLKILSIWIAASGWDYESLVTNVSLVGE